MRNTDDLPRNVEIKNGHYQYRHQVPAKLRRLSTIDNLDARGRAPRVVLCPVGSSKSMLYKTLAAAVQAFEHEADPEFLSLRWLHRKWKEHNPVGRGAAGKAFKGLALSTQKRYIGCEKLLEHELTINARKATFGDCRADKLTTFVIRQVLDKRYDQETGLGQLNNELAMIGSMYKYAKQYRPEIKLAESPTKGIEKFHIEPRKRYVTDADYALQYSIAGEIDRDYLQDYMELTFMLAARGCEVCDLTIASGNKSGVIVERRKGSQDTGINWSPRLEAAWKRALSRHTSKPLASSARLLMNRHGKSVSKTAVDDAWGLVRDEMKRRGLSDIYFRAHDLKRKGISDSTAKGIAGQSEQMQRQYDVDVNWFDAPG